MSQFPIKASSAKILPRHTIVAAGGVLNRRAKCFSCASGEVSGHIGMPVWRLLYTVLRSPHVDEKSREQFKTEVKREFVVMRVEREQLDKKLFWLKRRKDFGTMEVMINVQTLLPVR